MPDANRIGDGDGWRVSLTTLMNSETPSARAGGGPPKRGSGAIGAVVDIWNSLPEDRKTPVKRDAVMKEWVKAEVLRLTNMRGAANRKAGNPGPEMSVAKLAAADVNKSCMELAVTLQGPAGLVDFDYTFRRPEDLSVSGHRRTASVTRSFACGPTRSRAVRARSCATSSGSRFSACPASPGRQGPVNWIDVPRS
ncbi:MAG: acyl-CoA dehydrogenase family protein [Acidimicrobiales bacterium]